MNDVFRGIKKVQRVAVIGDVLVDEYYYGKVKRVSPEFPVPILRSDDFLPEYAPGGAANVCYQLTHFNADVSLFGFIDKSFSKNLSWLKFNLEGSPCLDTCVPRKIRFYDDDFPLLRWDIEKDNYGLSVDEINENREQLFKRWKAQKDQYGFDVVILSNYGKGVFSEPLVAKIIEECRMAKIKVVADPKTNLSWWYGCNVFKPNAAEALAMTGLTDWKEQCEEIAYRTACDSIIITQAGNGVVGKTHDHYFEDRCQQTMKEVSSVIGAGDCFVAILSLLIAHKFIPETAAHIAFAAGAEYVKAKHNRPITPYELYRRLDKISAKMVSVDELLDLKEKLYPGHRFVFTNGCFDILHTGHLATLDFAKKQGDKLIVALNSDDSVTRLKGPSRPVLPLEERSKIIAALDAVDFVISFDEDTPLKVIEQIKPQVIVKGADYRESEVCGSNLANEICLAPIIPGNSTTNIIKKIMKR